MGRFEGRADVSGWKLWPLIVLVAAGIVLAGADEPFPAHTDLQRALGILQYLTGDYCEAVDEQGKLLSQAELDEQLELVDDVLGILAEQTEPASRTILRQARDIRRHIAGQQPPHEVVPQLRDLHTHIVRGFDVQIAPTTVPALPVGRLVYESSCITCHGEKGDADTPIARTLEPGPRSFLAPEQELRLSPYAVFAAVSWGIPGTAMPGFETLEEDERWSVAFYVASLRQGGGALPAQLPASNVPALTIHDLAFATDRDLLELLNGVPENQRRAQLRRWRLDLPLGIGR
jgi:high-affinity iron transporter